MSTKFPFNHFIKLEGLSDTNNSDKLEHSSPVILSETLKSFEAQSPNQIESEFTTEELQSITEAILDSLKLRISASKFHAYFSSSFTVSSIQEETIEILVSTPFIQKIILSHYIDALKASFHDILGKQYEISVNILGQSQSLTQNHQQPKTKKLDSVKTTSFFINDLDHTKDDLYKAIDSKIIEHETGTSSTQIDIYKTFSNFVTGPSNNIAHALSMAVAKDPGRSYPALYIYGSSGLGKTHLTHAIANQIQVLHPGMRICITSASKFMKEMVEHISQNKIFDFKKKYTEMLDVLIIDDIHELKNRTTTQNEFFNVFNELIERKKQLVFTSDKPPKEIDGIEERIKTRLSSALPVEVQQPDLETRIAILKKKAIEKDIYLSDDVVNLIAKCVKSNIRELEGCLIKLGAVTSILKVDVDLEFAKEHLKLNDELENQKNLTIETITKAVAHYYKVPMGDIRGKTKTKEVALPRQVAMYLISKMIKPTLKETGHYFSGRDHSTVLHAINTIRDRIKIESTLAQQLLDIEKQL